MEENLLEDIDYSNVADHLFVSAYHFHRVFSLMTGISPSEYLRNRRLSQAAQDLSLTELKVIDLAYKYGYESPESFTKAFTRFHGISPSDARRRGGTLKLYHRLIIKLIVEGGMLMNYRIVEQEGFKLLVKKSQFSNEIISQEDSNEIPQFWNRCSEDGTLKLLSQLGKDKSIYGACSPISKASQLFDYGIGCEYTLNDVPAGFDLWQVKPTLWAVFDCIGENGACIGETWDKIFKEFLVASEYDMLDDLDFEKYPELPKENVFCEIWIPIRRK